MPVGDPTAGQVVGTQLHLDLVAGEDADVVLAHLPGDGGEDGMPPVELHPEHRARERLDDLAFDFDLLFLGGQILPYSDADTRTALPCATGGHRSKVALAVVRIL